MADEGPGQVRREQLDRVQDIGHHQVHVQGDAEVAMLLHREPAHDPVRDAVVRQHGPALRKVSSRPVVPVFSRRT